MKNRDVKDGKKYRRDRNNSKYNDSRRKHGSNRNNSKYNTNRKKDGRNRNNSKEVIERRRYDGNKDNEAKSIGSRHTYNRNKKSNTADKNKYNRKRDNSSKVIRERTHRKAYRRNKNITKDNEKKIYILFYKPKGIITTFSPYEGLNILDFVRLKKNFGYAGRLDKDAEGLILLTNDGELINKITHPRFKTEKVYDVKINKPFKDFSKFRELIIGKMKIRAGIKPLNKPKTRLRVFISEGRKHIVKIIFSKLGYHVNELKRIRIGGLPLGNLKPGQYKLIPKAQAYLTVSHSNDEYKSRVKIRFKRKLKYKHQ